MVENSVLSDFDKGRIYERRETLEFIAGLLKLDDDNEFHNLLRAWAIENAESLRMPTKRVVMIQDTYVVL